MAIAIKGYSQRSVLIREAISYQENSACKMDYELDYGLKRPRIDVYYCDIGKIMRERLWK